MAHFAAALTVLLTAAPLLTACWVYGGSVAQPLSVVMPWASAACAVGVFLLPMRHKGEGAGAAALRVWKSAMHDPFFWTAIALSLYLVIPLFNVALCPVCDWEAIDAGQNPYPPARWLPFCVNPAEHAGLLHWFPPAFLSAFGVRHSLTRGGKRAFLELMVWNSAALSFLGYLQLLSGAQCPYWGSIERYVHFFSVFGYPNMGGSFFVMGYAFSLGLWCLRMSEIEDLSFKDEKIGDMPEHPFIAAHYPVVAVALNAAGVLGTLCRAAMSLMMLLTALFWAYMLARTAAVSGVERARRFRSVLSVLLMYFAMVSITFVYAPPDIGRELKTISFFSVAERVSGKGQYHTKVAAAVMRDFPIFGVGGWGYKHFCTVYMNDAELRELQKEGGVNVHNDYLQILVEHGAVGFALLMACIVLLAMPSMKIWKQLTITSASAARSRLGSSSLAVCSVSPPVLWITVGCLAMLFHAFGDCPMRSAAVLLAFIDVVPAIAGFLPRQEDLQ